jgi:hypothetical protein
MGIAFQRWLALVESFRAQKIALQISGYFPSLVRDLYFSKKEIQISSYGKSKTSPRHSFLAVI